MSGDPSLCTVHRHGRQPGDPPYYLDACRKCRELKAAGKRTGNEPPPPTDGNIRAGRRAQSASFWSHVAAKAARAKPTPGPR